MRKTFEIIGLISLTCFSFFITEKTAMVVNNMDDIMIQINENRDAYKTNSINAVINENTIIPGIMGRVVNTNKSYKQMKKSGYYSDKLYIYDYNKPKISLEDNIDKYIIRGNNKKRMVSLIFRVKYNDDISEILKIINNYNVKSTFFVDETWFSNNNDLIHTMIKDGHNVGIFLKNYSDPDFEWMDIVIKKISNSDVGFCYMTDHDEKNKRECNRRKNYLLSPVEISETMPFADIKKIIDSENLFSLPISSQVKKELSTIIIYIKSKGYKITNLSSNILE